MGRQFWSKGKKRIAKRSTPQRGGKREMRKVKKVLSRIKTENTRIAANDGGGSLGN